jgi:hypothetical protein
MNQYNVPSDKFNSGLPGACQPLKGGSGKEADMGGIIFVMPVFKGLPVDHKIFF